jgi:hypothetical protein
MKLRLGGARRRNGGTRDQFLCCSLVAPPLHEQVENLAFAVDRAEAIYVQT